MAKIQVLVVEDNALAAMDLCETLEEEGYALAGSFHRAEDVVVWLKDKRADVALVDICLAGGLDGISLSQMLHANGIPVIYLTAQQDSQTLRRALETHPSAYLTKPFKEIDLLAALSVAANGGNTTSAPLTEDVFQVRDALFVKNGKRYEKIVLDEIQWIEAQRSYATVVCKDRRITLSISMSTALDKLNCPHIVRIHRSYSANLKYVSAFDTQEIFIGEHALPMSAQYREAFTSALQKL